MEASVQFESDMRMVRGLYLQVVLPVAMALFLIHVRGKYTIGRYLVAVTPFLAFALLYARYHEDVFLGTASGFDSPALVYAFASVAVLCVLRTRSRWAQAAQVLGSLFAENYWILRASWVEWHEERREKCRLTR